MNLHPVLVHFPVALLSLYSLLELARFRFLTRLSFFWPCKAFLLAFGTLGAYAAYVSGKWGTGAHSANLTPIIDTHAAFALALAALYSLLALLYLIAFLSGREEHASAPLSPLSRIANSPFVLMSLAAIGFGLLSITGGLGGGLVYGPDVDPAVHFIYSFFF